MTTAAKKSEKAFTPDQETLIGRLDRPDAVGIQIPFAILARKARLGDFNYETLEKLYKASRETANINNKDLRQFVELLAKLDLTELPGKGQGLYEIGAILFGKKKGTPTQQEYVRKLIKSLTNQREGFKLQPDDLEAIFEDIRQLGLTKETPDEIAAATKTKVATSDTRASVRASAEAITKQKNSIYKPEPLDKQTVDQIRTLEKSLITLWDRYNKHDHDGNEAQRDAVQSQIDNIENQLEPLKQIQTDWLERNLRRKRGIDDASRKSGIDLTSGAKIETAIGKIEIDKITFDTETRLELEPYGPGVLTIHYRLNGKPQQPTIYSHFCDLMRSHSAFQTVKSLDELHTRIEEKSGFAPLQQGQIYNSKQTNQTFTIKSINKNGTITVHPSVTTRFANLLTKSARMALPKDISKDKLSFGEFAALLIAQDFRRQIDLSEVPHIVKKNHDRINQRIASYTPEDPEAAEIFHAIDSSAGEEPPSIGQKSKIYWLEDGNKLHQGEFEALPNGTFQFTPEPVWPKKLEGVPERFRAGRQQNPSPADLKPPVSKWLKSLKKDPAEVQIPPAPRIFQPWEIIEQARDGRLYDVPKNITPANDDVEITLDRTTAMNSTLAPGVKDQLELPFEEPPAAPPEPPKPEPPKPAFDPDNPPNPEALHYDLVHRVLPGTKEDEGYLKSLYSATKFLSVADLWQMGTTMWEYYDRRLKNKQKQRFATVGKDLKYFGPEMQRINQQTETDEMNQFKDALDQFGVNQTTDRIRSTRNFFELKACFISLVGKGQLRWDDVAMWENVNRFAPADKKIPIPKDRNPHTIVKMDGKRGLTGIHFLKPVLDGFWGDGTFDDWFSSNKSTYQGNAQKYAEEGKALEGEPGGYGARLAYLLRLHKEGDEFVDPQRYEGLLLAAIDNGKGSMQDKLYYMIQGVACVNKKGRTIMDFDRISHINATYLVRFPFLDYICTTVPRPPDGQPHKFTLEDYKSWAKRFDQGREDNVRPTTAVDEFLWNHALTANQTITRINKVRNYGGYDPDDTFAFFPTLDVQLITDACNMGTVGGGQKSTSTEAYKNIFPGFAQYIKTFAEKGNASRLVDVINSFVRFEAIMTNRYEKNNTIYQRLDQKQIDKGSVVSGVKSSVHIQQVNNVIDKIVDAYIANNIPGAAEVRSKLTLARTVVSEEQFIQPSGKALQDQINAALKALPRLFNKMTDQDQGQIMLAVAGEAVGNKEITGMPYQGDEEELDKRKMAAA